MRANEIKNVQLATRTNPLARSVGPPAVNDEEERTSPSNIYSAALGLASWSLSLRRLSSPLLFLCISRLIIGSYRPISDNLLRPFLLFDHAAFQGFINGFTTQQGGHHHGDERSAQEGDSEIAATRHLYGQDDACKRRAHARRK